MKLIAWETMVRGQIICFSTRDENSWYARPWNPDPDFKFDPCGVLNTNRVVRGEEIRPEDILTSTVTGTTLAEDARFAEAPQKEEKRESEPIYVESRVKAACGSECSWPKCERGEAYPRPPEMCLVRYNEANHTRWGQGAEKARQPGKNEEK